MNKFMKLLKNGRIAQVCRLTALVITLIGVMQVGLELYSIWMVYRSFQSGQPGSVPNFEYYTYLIPNITSALQNTITTVFFVVILYILGAIISAFFGSSSNAAKDEMAIIYEPLDDSSNDYQK